MAKSPPTFLRLFGVLLAAVLFACGCGKKGPLYLPGSQDKTAAPVTGSAPATLR